VAGKNITPIEPPVVAAVIAAVMFGTLSIFRTVPATVFVAAFATTMEVVPAPETILVTRSLFLAATGGVRGT
jgi:hypothetical protein